MYRMVGCRLNNGEKASGALLLADKPGKHRPILKPLFVLSYRSKIYKNRDEKVFHAGN